MIRKLILLGMSLGYKQVAKRIIFILPAQGAHDIMIQFLNGMDRVVFVQTVASFFHKLTFRKKEVEIGGITLRFPFILAAGFVKGTGFTTEEDALNAVEDDVNIIPGWRTMPNLVGLVEFGSYTRYPRLGNEGTVMWRDAETLSTQNRVGLKNPGVKAASAFLAKKRKKLPKQFGINIAISPGVDDLNQQVTEVIESLDVFLDQDIIPTWFTLNISCPNTEDDPSGTQTEQLTRNLCEHFVSRLQERDVDVPLWVKVSPDLDVSQYRILMRVFHETGVKAVIATNTLAKPTPDNPKINAGVGGGELHVEAMIGTAHLQLAKIHNDYDVDVIGCGGVLNGETYKGYVTLGVEVVQYWSALVFRGPFAAAIIESELPKYEAEYNAVSFDKSGEFVVADRSSRV